MAAKDTPKKDLVLIRFVDSKNHPIPYFSRRFEYFGGEGDIKAFKNYLHPFPWDELLPYQGIGGGIMPMRSDTLPYFLDEINLEFQQGSADSSLQKFKNAELPLPAERYLLWYFPNGQVHMMSLNETSRLKRDQVNVIAIPGDLGSGKWKELGDFLFDASFNWRIDRGSRKDLIKRCNALIDEKTKEGDRAWAGNLTFIREHWLHASAHVGLFGRAQEEPPAGLDKELPWQGAAREFGRGGVALSSYPWQPYVAFRKVLEVNPRDVRAIFWTRLLPLVNGFMVPYAKNGATTVDYIRECRRVYGATREQLDDYHRFWFLKEFIQTANGMTYSERYWMKKPGVKHDANIQWAVDELGALFTKYPFLKYQILYLKEWLLYMKDPNQVEPLNLIDGK